MMGYLLGYFRGFLEDVVFEMGFGFIYIVVIIFISSFREEFEVLKFLAGRLEWNC